jgi:transcriptional regulator with XRE-family HTH domain
MSIASDRQIGARVRKWRDRLELTIDDLSRMSGLSTGRLVDVELGTSPISAFEVYRLAHGLGADPGSLLFEEQAVGDPVRGAVRFKREDALAGVGARDRRLLAVAAEVGRVGASLCRLLSRGGTALPTYSTPLSTTQAAWEQGYELGVAAREELQLGLTPIPHLIQAFEGLGVHVAFVAFEDDDINAASIREPDAVPVILVNQTENRAFERRSLRPTLAHELCHLLHDNNRTNVLTSVSLRSAHDDGAESRANAFAPAFLAPPAGVGGADLPDEELVLRLVEDWSFSVVGACWHVRNIRRLSEERAQELAHSVRPRATTSAGVSEAPSGAAESLPASPSPLTCGLVSRLAAEALEAGLISEGRAREIARIA